MCSILCKYKFSYVLFMFSMFISCLGQIGNTLTLPLGLVQICCIGLISILSLKLYSLNFSMLLEQMSHGWVTGLP